MHWGMLQCIALCCSMAVQYSAIFLPCNALHRKKIITIMKSTEKIAQFALNCKLKYKINHHFPKCIALRVRTLLEHNLKPFLQMAEIFNIIQFSTNYLVHQGHCWLLGWVPVEPTEWIELVHTLHFLSAIEENCKGCLLLKALQPAVDVFQWIHLFSWHCVHLMAPENYPTAIKWILCNQSNFIWSVFPVALHYISTVSTFHTVSVFCIRTT